LVEPTFKEAHTFVFALKREAPNVLQQHDARKCGFDDGQIGSEGCSSRILKSLRIALGPVPRFGERLTGWPASEKVEFPFAQSAEGQEVERFVCMNVARRRQSPLRPIAS
jgi:hypothetical protein